MAKHKSAFERLSGDRLNRKQRRLSIVNPNAGGIDVGNESHFVAVPSDRDPSPVQEFGCWTADLIRMAKWLQSGRIDTVAIQATGVYWIAARHSDRPWHPRGWGERAEYEKRAGPENGCPAVSVAWPPARRHGQLHTYGLLRDSFHLAKEMEGVHLWSKLAGGRVVRTAAGGRQLPFRAPADAGMRPPDRELSGKPAECSDPRACGKPSAKQCDEALHLGIQPGEAENRKSKGQPADDTGTGSGTGTDLRKSART